MTDRRLSILVVDDDAADARLVIRAGLRKAGFEVRLAEGGEDGLRQFRADPCDLVMLDVDRPDLGGHEVCAILRAEAGPLLPIVMVTGMDDVASVEAAYQHGATDFIAKPVHWALIGHRVRYLFRSRQAMPSLACLTRMPIGNVKVDRCFGSGLLEDQDSEAIVRAVLAMARSLGMRVTAEGVETLEQARALKAMACDGLQGYCVSRPVPASRIPALLLRLWSLDDPRSSDAGGARTAARPPLSAVR